MTRNEPPAGSRVARIIGLAMVLAPAPALAHGDQILLLFDVTPFIVPVLALLFVWSSDLGRRQKLYTIAAVTGASVATLRFTTSIWTERVALPRGMEISLRLLFGAMAAHVIIPAVVWAACARIWRRRG